MTKVSIRCDCGHTEQGQIEIPSIIAFLCSSCQKKRAARLELLYDDRKKRLIVTEMEMRDIPATTGDHVGPLQITVVLE